jgi:predicted nucleic acid-binding protein
MNYLLDTSVLSQAIKNLPLPRVVERWSSLPESQLKTSSFCIAELLQGLEARDSATYWRRYRNLIEPYYRGLPFTDAVAQTYAQLHARLKTKGQPRPALDLLIAATAVHHDLVLATLNVKDFFEIPDLRLEDWSAG